MKITIQQRTPMMAARLGWKLFGASPGANCAGFDWDCVFTIKSMRKRVNLCILMQEIMGKPWQFFCLGEAD